MKIKRNERCEIASNGFLKHFSSDAVGLRVAELLSPTITENFAPRSHNIVSFCQNSNKRVSLHTELSHFNNVNCTNPLFKFFIKLIRI